MRIVFMGSPDFAVPSLQALSAQFDVVGVVTQPDRRAGRGRRMQAPAVKQRAEQLEIPCVQPVRIREPEAVSQVQEWKPDLIVVVAYGQIIRKDLLDLPPHGCINVHASLLPRWRGASPIQAAILHGDVQTGITIMQMDAGMDTGPIIKQRSTPIGPTETGGELWERLAPMGASLLLETLPDWIAGRIQIQPQTEADATYTSLLKKSDGELDWHHPAEQLARQVRAYDPWPRSYFQWKNFRIVVQKARAIEPGQTQTQTGRIQVVDQFPVVTTSQGLLLLETVQPAGKRSMGADAFLRGSPEFRDAILHSERRNPTPYSS